MILLEMIYNERQDFIDTEDICASISTKIIPVCYKIINKKEACNPHRETFIGIVNGMDFYIYNKYWYNAYKIYISLQPIDIEKDCRFILSNKVSHTLVEKLSDKIRREMCHTPVSLMLS